MAMKTYKVSTYNDKATYTVSVSDQGVVDVDGLMPHLAEDLKFSVDKFMSKYGLPVAAALAKAAGPYSYVTDADESVADEPEAPGVV